LTIFILATGFGLSLINSTGATVMTGLLQEACHKTKIFEKKQQYPVSSGSGTETVINALNLADGESVHDCSKCSHALFCLNNGL